MLIGEVSRRSGVSARMLRHYDRIGIVSPTERTGGGYREYSEADVRRLFHVEGLRSLGLGLQEVADALDDLSFSPAAMVDRLITRTERRLAQETKLLNDLRQVRDSEPGAWSDALAMIALMHGLDADDASERQRSALMLGSGEERGVVALVEAALSETDLNAAGAMDWALAQAGDAAVAHLAEALASPIENRRRRAVEALTKIGSTRASEALADAVGNADPLVRARAWLASGRRGTADAIPALVDLVIDGRDDMEASDVLAALAVQHDHPEEVVTAIRARLLDADAGARRRLAAALTDIPGASRDATLRALATDPDIGVAATAAFVLRAGGAQALRTGGADVLPAGGAEVLPAGGADAEE